MRLKKHRILMRTAAGEGVNVGIARLCMVTLRLDNYDNTHEDQEVLDLILPCITFRFILRFLSNSGINGSPSILGSRFWKGSFIFTGWN